MCDLVERLRDAHANSTQRALGSNIFAEAADRITALELVVKPLVWVIHTNGWLSAETIGGEFWVQKGLSTSECQKRHTARILAALEPTTHAAQLAAALRLPEVAALVGAVLRLNAACDAMWNDHERLEVDPQRFGQTWAIKEVHMKAISEAQQGLPPVLTALEAKYE